MLQINSFHFNTDFRLEDGFRSCTKEQLLNIGRTLSLKGISKPNKEGLVKALSQFILENPTVWLNLLPEHELRLLDQLVAHAGATPLAIAPEIKPNLLQHLSLVVHAKDVKPGQTSLMIYEDLRRAIAPHLKAVLTGEANQICFLLESYFFGIINLYGLLPFDEVISRLHRLNVVSLPEEQIKSILLYKLSVQTCIFEFYNENESGLWVKSPYVLDVHTLDMEIQQRIEIREYKTFTKQQILAAGQRPYPESPNVNRQKLVPFLREKMHQTDLQICESLSTLWIHGQYTANPMSVVSNFIAGKLDNREQVQEAVSLFIEYSNREPLWMLKGHSPEETSKLFKKPATSSTMQMPMPMGGAGMNPFGPNEPSGPKQGRNDLCACGSGKKFKKCCGSN